MNPTILDVLVIGAGPTGTVLAIDLARRGLNVRIIDSNSTSFPGSRAKGIQPRSLELFDDLGVLDQILAAGSLYPLLGIHLGPFTIPRRMFKQNVVRADIPFPNTWLIPQYSIASILHNRLTELGISVEFQTKLVSFAQNVNEVQATVEKPSGTETISCKYMVGTDGGGSIVRRNLGIDFPGRTDESDHMILIDSKAEGLSNNYWHIWPGLGGRFIGACPLPGSDLFQWMVRLKPDEEPDISEEAIKERIALHIRSKKVRLYDIQWISVWRPNIRLAERYSVGRIFIAGDAAHVHPPTGAQGLNTGVQDAYNLAWKLAQVISGAPQQLLDTYEEERRPIAAGVLGLSTKKYETLGSLKSSSIERGKDEQQLLLTYQGGPLATENTVSTATLQVGDRAPDALLRSPDKGSIRLFELLRGPHFTLLAFGPSAAKEMPQILWPDAGAALKRVTIDSGESVESDFQLEDDNASFKEIYGLSGDTLILVRPDGYIGQIASSSRFAAISESICTMTASATAGT